MFFAKVCASTAVAALLLTGCGSSEPKGAALDQTTPSPTAAASVLPDPGAPVAAGRYQTTALQASLSLTLPEGFAVLVPEAAGAVTLSHPGASGAPEAIFAILRPTRVVDPAARLQGKELPASALVPVPDDVIGFLAKHPGLREVARGTVKADGTTIETIDTAVPAIATSTCGGGTPNCLSLFAVQEQQFTISSPWLVRNYVVPTSSGALVIGMIAFDPKQAPALFAKSDAIVSRSTWPSSP